ncbi:MAG TPA: PAS domain S-box protein, partial [Xanthomonadales bacterium]|nr:PAS domain S-box protein [Xanthomonadales bacterium]
MKPPASDKEQFDMLETLLDAAVDAIIIIDDKGKILRFNRTAQILFGYSAEAVQGQNVSMLMPEPNRRQHDGYLQRYRESGQAAIIGKGREEWGLRSDGSTFPMRLSVGESVRGQSVQYVGIIHDLSQQRDTEAKLHALEEQLFHAERLVTLGELTAGIAHEINQPLTAIAAYADAGARLQPDRASSGGLDYAVICQKIADQARRAGQVVDRLRELVHGNRASKSQQEVGSLIRNVLTVFDHELKYSHIKLQLRIPLETPTVYVDEIQIQQIIVNLVKNSIDSIREKSGANAAAEGHIEITVSHDEKAVHIKVTDDGVGVSPEHQERLFEPFFTSKPKGFGLGLSICRNIAGLHGG